MKKRFWLFFLVGMVALWNTAYKLDVQPMYLWDESRQANNALEMAENNNFLYTTYENQPDFWNTKPHLLVIIQAIFFKILGPGLLALRLPSAMAAAGTILIWFVFLFRRKQIAAAFIFLLIILSCRGFNVYHIARTGDYDSLLTLLLSATLVLFYQYITEGNRIKKRNAAATFFALALLTKSFAALLWLPLFTALYFLFAPEKKRWIKELAMPFGAAILVVSIYYALHEIWTPGYLQAVWENEIGGRYFRPNEGHESSWYYYLDILYNQYFQGFIYLLVLSFPALWFVPPVARKTSIFFLSAAILFLILISVSATKIHWYMAPAIPLFTMVIALVTGAGLQQKGAIRIIGVSCVAAIICVSSWQFSKLWRENLLVEGVNPQWVLKQAEVRGEMPYQGWWLHGNYKPIENFYGAVFAKKKILFLPTDKFRFKPSDTVLLYHFEQTDSIHKYNYCRQWSAPRPELPVWVFVVDSARQF